MDTNIDLITLIESDLGQGHRSGRWVRFHCPFPGHKNGDRNPSLAVTNGDGSRGAGWKCFGCDRHGDARKWLMEYRGLSYADATSALKLPQTDTARRHTFEPPIQKPDTPPGETWQARARQLIDRCELALWDGRGKDALEWLQARGLNTDTIRKAHLGYIPKKFEDRPEAWGLPRNHPKVTLPTQSILIPGIIAGNIWYLKRRKLHPRDKDDRYGPQVPGGKSSALYLADSLSSDRPAVFCEGEFDALLLKQEIQDLASVVTMGAASNNLNLATWGLYLLRPSSFILALDPDSAGEQGSAKLSWLHNSQRLKIPQLQPGDKDITDFHKSGGNLYSLVESVIRPEAPIFVRWPVDEKPATVGGQYWRDPDQSITAFYLPDQLDLCLDIMSARSQQVSF